MNDVSRYCVECERLQAEVDRLQAKYEIVLRDSTIAMTEVDRMRPVVEAAMCHDGTPRSFKRLVDARESYRAAKGADDE